MDIRSTSYTPPTLPTTGSWSTDSFILAPSYFGLTSFSSGTYFFEFRFIAEKCLYKICTSVTVNMPTPTPTPTPSPTPGGPTPTPAPVGQCYCYEVQVTGTTGGEGGIIATLDYNDCYAVRTGRAFTIGPGTYKVCIQTVGGVVQWFPEGTYGIDTSNLLIPGVGNCNTGYSCSGYVPAGTPTPTPTATPTPTPGGPTPTPTPPPCHYFSVNGVYNAGTSQWEVDVAYQYCNGTGTSYIYSSFAPISWSDCARDGTVVVNTGTGLAYGASCS